jgi:hypothetical protein
MKWLASKVSESLEARDPKDLVKVAATFTSVRSSEQPQSVKQRSYKHVESCAKCEEREKSMRRLFTRCTEI